jgi:hypothetical protein
MSRDADELKATVPVPQDDVPAGPSLPVTSEAEGSELPEELGRGAGCWTCFAAECSMDREGALGLPMPAVAMPRGHRPHRPQHGDPEPTRPTHRILGLRAMSEGGPTGLPAREDSAG